MTIFEAVTKGHLEEVKEIISREGKKCTEAVYGEDKYTLLHLAVKSEQSEIAKELLVINKDLVNAQNRLKKTPLLYAAECEFVEMTKLLLEKGCNANIADHHKETALVYGDENKEITELLLKHGANIYTANTDGIKPIDNELVKNTLKKILETNTKTQHAEKKKEEQQLGKMTTPIKPQNRYNLRSNTKRKRDAESQSSRKRTTNNFTRK